MKIVYPEKAWAELQEMLIRGEDAKTIAESDDGTVEIVLESMGSGYGCVSVLEDGNVVVCDTFNDEAECEDSVSHIYRSFLDGEEEPELTEEEQLRLEIEDREAEIEDREAALEDAAVDFLTEMLRNTEYKDKISIDEYARKIIDAIAKSLHRAGVDVYRPMYLKDEESGDIDYFEFPYSEM